MRTRHSYKLSGPAILMIRRPAGTVHGIGRAAGGFRKIANADATVIHKMPIAFLHIAPKIVFRCVYVALSAHLLISS